MLLRGLIVVKHRGRTFAPCYEAYDVTMKIMFSFTHSHHYYQGGKTVRFFKRKTHPEDLLEKEDGSTLRYTVLGLGDSNLLLDRQTTGPKDCNQVAEAMDRRLEELGGTRVHDLGLDDERSGLTNVEGWIEGVQACIAGILADTS